MELIHFEKWKKMKEEEMGKEKIRLTFDEWRRDKHRVRGLTWRGTQKVVADTCNVLKRTTSRIEKRIFSLHPVTFSSSSWWYDFSSTSSTYSTTTITWFHVFLLDLGRCDPWPETITISFQVSWDKVVMQENRVESWLFFSWDSLGKSTENKPNDQK